MTASTNPDDKVGYCKPPKHRQFKPGQSGNARGSARADTEVDDVWRMMRKKVGVNTNGRKRGVPLQEIMVFRLVKKAMAGDLRSAKQLFDLERRYRVANVAKTDPKEAEAEARKTRIFNATLSRLSMDTKRELSDILAHVLGERPTKYDDPPYTGGGLG